MRAAHYQKQVHEEDDAEDDERADLEPDGKFHKNAFRRVQKTGVSLSGEPVHLVLMWLPATPGRASVPCVLTFVALGILPYVTSTLP